MSQRKGHDAHALIMTVETNMSAIVMLCEIMIKVMDYCLVAGNEQSASCPRKYNNLWVCLIFAHLACTKLIMGDGIWLAYLWHWMFWFTLVWTDHPCNQYESNFWCQSGLSVGQNH